MSTRRNIDAAIVRLQQIAVARTPIRDSWPLMPVFIAGDRQACPAASPACGSPFPTPNANGCSAFNGNMFRWNGTALQNVVCAGANATARVERLLGESRDSFLYFNGVHTLSSTEA